MTRIGLLGSHRSRLVGILTRVYGGAVVFGFGVLIGRLTEPVPAMPAGVHALAWLVLPLMVGAMVVPLVNSNRVARRLSPAEVRSQRFAVL